jgi:hypothetical protein
MTDRFIVFDCELRRPGCVLLQAAYGVDPRIAHEFPAETWLISPTKNMARYQIATDEQLDKLVQMAVAAIEDSSDKKQGT